MLQFGMCRRCQIEIPEDRLELRPVVCPSCGFTQNTNDIVADEKLERRFIKVAITLALAMIVGFVQVATWDHYALEIIPLKLKQVIGLADNDDLSRIAKICLERHRYECVETNYAIQAARGDIEALAALGKFQARRHRIGDAAQTFAQYFNRGGLDLEANYQYAKVLGELGQIERASSYFDHVLAAKPDTLQISVTQNYVRMLIHNGRSEQAKALIESIRKTSPSASLFMEDEIKALAQTNVR